MLLLSPVAAIAYSSKNIKLTQNEYTRWVKPQLKNISQDYQTLLTLLNPNLKNVKENFALFKALRDKSEYFISSCATPGKIECTQVVNEYISILGRVIVSTETLELKKDSGLNVIRENTIETLELHSLFQQYLMDLYFKFLNYSFFYNSEISSSATPNSLIKDIHQIYNSYNFYILSNSDPRFFEAFSEFWNDFIRPVESILLVEKDKSHYIRRLNDLNLRWNFFHVELTKRNKTVSKAVTSLLTTMHNRWKISLRVTLR